jgi:hypothetical protein
MHWRLPDKGNLLDEADGLHPRTTDPAEEGRSVYEGLGRRLSPSYNTFLFLIFILQ